MTSVPPPPGTAPAPRRGLDWRRLGIVAVVGVLLALASIGIASMLDDPVGGAAQDKAQPAVDGSVAGLTPDTGGTGTSADPSNAQLPPFAMILERPFPDGLSEAAADRAVAGLAARLARARTPRRLVELASAYQRAGQVGKAEALYREALRADPTFIPAQVGLAMAPGEDGTAAGLDRAQAGLAVLLRGHPRNQLIVFNQAWTALYRRDASIALPALRTASRLDPNSFLGAIAASLLAAADGKGGSTGP